MQTAADVVMAVAIAVVSGYAALALSSDQAASTGSSFVEGIVVGPRGVAAASYVGASLALIARRRAPVATLVVAMTALSIPFLFFGSSEGAGTLAPVLVALYTVAAHRERHTAVWALAAFTGYMLLDGLRDPLNHDVRSVLGAWPLYLLGVIVWLAGLYVRTRRQFVAELRGRAERAERSREERIRAATADERARIARELHDAVAHSMSVMVIQAEAAEEMLAGDPERARIPIERVQRVGREGLAEMRRLLGVLRQDESPVLAPQPGVAALPQLVDQVCSTGLPVELDVLGEPRPLPAGVDISAYRIVQEALTNAIKHAAASRVVVRVRYGEELELEIVDDGVGGLAPGSSGHGLVGMRERVALYGGTLDTGRPAGGGYRVRATLPCAEPA
jgi:signal transduction histidine kinase